MRQSLLPVVHENIGHSVQHGLPGNDESITDYLIHSLKDLDDKNPCVARFMAAYALECEEECKEAILLSGILVYRLLESQAEADRMMEELKLV